MSSTLDAQSAPAAETPTIIGDLLTQLRAIRDEKESRAEYDKKLQGREMAIRAQLFQYHADSGLAFIANDLISVSFSQKLTCRVDPEKWESFFKWAVESGNHHVLYHQASDAKLLELSNGGVAMPEGVSFSAYTDWKVTRKLGNKQKQNAA